MAGMRSDMQRVAEVPTGTLPYKLFEEERERRAAARALDRHDKLLKEKRNAMAKANKEAGKAASSVTEAGRPEESLTETGRPEEFAAETWSPEESVTTGMDEEVMCKETNSIQIPVPQIHPDADPSATNSIQYHDVDPVKKEAEEVARLVSMVSSGDESLLHKETEELGKRSEMVGMNSGMQRHAEEPTAPMKFMGNYYSPEFVEQLMEQHAAPLTEAWGPKESVTVMYEVGRGKSSMEGSKPFIERAMPHMPMVDTEFKSEMEAETGKAEDAVVDMDLVGDDSEKDRNELGKKFKMMDVRSVMLSPEDYSRKEIIYIFFLKLKEYRLQVQRIEEEVKLFVANQEKLAKEELKVNARAKADAEAGKAEASVTERGRPEEFSTEVGKAEQIVMFGTHMVELDKLLTVELDKLLTKPADPSAINSICTLGQFSVKDDLDHERGKSDTPYAKKTATEEEDFASYSRDWESAWSKTRCVFQDITMLSSMQFTHYTPGLIARSSAGCTPETLQIFSIKLTEIAGGLELPLSVYGVIAARDIVDHNRNILFSCDRSDAQELKQNDPFLRLMGPSRAIVFTDKVNFEIELKVKDPLDSQDKALISCARRYTGGDGAGVSTICFKNVSCTLELCLQPVTNTVQATILGVCVVKKDGPWPFQHGGLIACSPLSGEYVFTHRGVSRTIEPSSSQIVLLESKDRAMPKGCGAYVHLSRKVVSVEVEGALDFVIKAYSESGVIANEGRVRFVAKNCNISQKKCALGDAEVIITVAWSLVATSRSALCSEVCNRARVV